MPAIYHSWQFICWYGSISTIILSHWFFEQVKIATRAPYCSCMHDWACSRQFEPEANTFTSDACWTVVAWARHGVMKSTSTWDERVRVSLDLTRTPQNTISWFPNDVMFAYGNTWLQSHWWTFTFDGCCPEVFNIHLNNWQHDSLAYFVMKKSFSVAVYHKALLFAFVITCSTPRSNTSEYFGDHGV